MQYETKGASFIYLFIYLFIHYFLFISPTASVMFLAFLLLNPFIVF